MISNRNLPHYLTEQVRKQAHTLSDKFISKNIWAIYASPIRRAQQTAQILTEKRHLPVHNADALRQFDYGVMEGHGDEEA
jgi:broad specificity phosphatase PhoE